MQHWRSWQRIGQAFGLGILLLSSFGQAQAADKKSSQQEIEGLCLEKATQAGAAVAQINDPGTGQVSAALVKARRKTADFDIMMRHDDKTKTYTVTAEFSRANKWCQIMSVRLTATPQ